MTNSLRIWQLIHRSLHQDIPVMLLYVLESRGSSPGRQGFFMAVNSEGEMEGSIGGGIMEYKFVEMAKERLKDSGGQQISFLRKQVHDKSSARDQSGMICSGEQTNFIYRLQTGDISIIEAIVECIKEDKTGLLQINPRGLLFSKDITGPQRYDFDFQNDLLWSYQELVGYKNNLYIIGGGHCALALSRIMGMMNFYIHVFDTRSGLNTVDQNHSAHRKHFLSDYSELSELVPSDANQFIVIMTFGYRTDEIAVKALLSKEFLYFGLLGSEKKVRALFSDLLKDGFSQQQLDRILAPIGLQINSQTPEEIAISIAAQIIAVKNRFVKSDNDGDAGKGLNGLSRGNI